MIVLAFDLATTTGVAVGGSYSDLKCWSEELGEAGVDQCQRMNRMLNVTNTLIKRYRPDAVAVEMPIATGPIGRAARVQMAFGLRGCVMAMAYAHGRKFLEADVSTVRKHFIGHGGLPSAEAKKAVFDECVSRGVQPDGYDSADAVAVWSYIQSKHFNKSDLGGLFSGKV